VGVPAIPFAIRFNDTSEIAIFLRSESISSLTRANKLEFSSKLLFLKLFGININLLKSNII